MKKNLALRLGLALALGFVCGCGDSAQPPAGSGGTSGSGGAAGTGGKPGTGGVIATGGAGGGGSTGSGGAAGQGGAGTGGTASGGVTGTDGSADAGGGSDTAGGSGDAGSDAAETAPPATDLDACFQGLRKLAVQSQIASKKSADGKYQVRLALERIPDSVGTSGTVPWRVVRIGFVTPAASACVKEESTLAGAYKGSLHNCSDTLKVSAGATTFDLKTPDTTPGRTQAQLSVNGGTAQPLTQVTCMKDAGGECTSGGPCQ
jgi:hypothetical protein